jgi:RHS repeat-associated protein
VFNNLNRLFRELGATSQTTEYVYDNQGNVTSVKDPLNKVTANAYDALNRLRQVTDPGSGVTQYAYNGLDALTSVTDPRGLVTNYTVDGLGNLTLQASPDTGNTASTYDAAGNLLTQTDAKGQVTTYAYDALNRVTLATFHDGSKQASVNDSGAYGIGRLSSITETNPAMQVTHQIAYAYDPHGRVTSETRTLGGQAYVTAYSYDSSGHMSGMTYPSGRTVSYAFDSLGRVSAVNTTPSGGSQQVVVQNVTYHPFGGVTGFTFGNSQAYTRAVDQDGRISSYTLGAQSYGVGYDAASRITDISEVGNPSSAITYGYDSLDRLTSAVLPSSTYTYGYDPVGNRVTKTAGASTHTYAYSGSSNRLVSVTPTSGPVRNFSFDANGSTLADGLNTYAYDVRGRMDQATSSVGGTAYQVNALGQRVRKSNSLGDTVFHYDTRGRLVAETSPAGAVVREYIYLGDIPVGVVQGQGALHYVHTDHLNTPRLVADATGTTVWRWDQAEPFGANPADSDPDGNSVAFDLPLRLPGLRYDLETGLHYNYYRDYDPSIGRYGESDPVGLRGGTNTYVYVLGRPLRDVDVFGLSVWICNREVQGFPGTGNHAYVWNDKTGKACSMRGSSGFGLPSESELGPTRPGVKGDSCVELPGSPGKEDEIMNCCRASANSGVWFPWVNDCHNAADKCIRKSGLSNPGAPGGRTGECDSCQPKQYPDLYGTP